MFFKSTLIVLSLLSTVLSVKPTWKELDNYNFNKYVGDFRLNIVEGSAEWEMRKNLFTIELERVKAHNAKNLSWKEGINKFSYLTKDEKKAFFGRSKGVAKHHAPKNRKEFDYVSLGKPVSSLPTSADWRESGIVSVVKDQGYCGSCWAFAATAVLESHVAKETGLLFDLSPEEIAMCSPNPEQCGGSGGCSGATAEVAFDYVASSSGIHEEYQYPYLSYFGTNYDCSLPPDSASVSITGYVQLPVNNYTALMNAIATVGPIAVSVDASTFHSYESGIFSGCNQVNPDINHAVTLVGFGEENGQKYWLVRNSWSPEYGEKGYIRVGRLDTEEEVCGMDITPSDGNACSGETDPVRACGTCGILFDSSYPVGAALA